MATEVQSSQVTLHMHNFSGSSDSIQAAAEQPPTQSTLDACSSVPVFDKDGKSQPFKDLYKGSGRHLVIFVRHFFCGMCQDFLRALCASLGPQDLMNLQHPTTISLIGCGDPTLLKDYISNTNCSFPIYADPSRKLYETLGMTCSLSQGSKKPDYQVSSLMGVVGKSLVQVVSSGTGAFKGGHQSQNGGEFLFENDKVTWCHRMRNTRDHTEIPLLRQILGFNAL